MPSALRLLNVRKTFVEGERRREVLIDASAELAAGELVALLGRSGSGKSTLLHLCAAMDRPDAGRIEVDGQEISGLMEKERTMFRRRKVGFVFQFFNLLPTLTVEENVRLPLALCGRGGDPEAGREVRRLLDAVGLADRGGAFPDRLSGGEQQRVAVARALVHAPTLILADEPTGALDADTGRTVLSLFLGLARERRATVLLSSHNAEVARAADRILVLDEGRLAPRERAA